MIHHFWPATRADFAYLVGWCHGHPSGDSDPRTGGARRGLQFGVRKSFNAEPKATAGSCPDSAVAFGSALNEARAQSASHTRGQGTLPLGPRNSLNCGSSDVGAATHDPRHPDVEIVGVSMPQFAANDAFSSPPASRSFKK
jgi:hypothetical protein